MFRRLLSALSGQDRVLFSSWPFTPCAGFKLSISNICIINTAKKPKAFYCWGVTLYSPCCSVLPCQNWDDSAEPEGEEEPQSENPGDEGACHDSPVSDADPESGALVLIEDSQSQPEPEVPECEMEPPVADGADDHSVSEGPLSAEEGAAEEEIPASTDAVRGSDSEMPSDPSEPECPQKAFELGEETVDRKPVKVQVFGGSAASERSQAIQRLLQNARRRRQAMIFEVALHLFSFLGRRFGLNAK